MWICGTPFVTRGEKALLCPRETTRISLYTHSSFLPSWTFQMHAAERNGLTLFLKDPIQTPSNERAESAVIFVAVPWHFNLLTQALYVRR